MLWSAIGSALIEPPAGSALCTQTHISERDWFKVKLNLMQTQPGAPSYISFALLTVNW